MIEVILLDKIAHLGELGDIVKVKPGYARNFLIPKEKALPATKKYKLHFEARKNEFVKAQAEAQEKAHQRIEAFELMKEILIKAKVGAEGRLFGAITYKDVVEQLNNIGFSVDKSELRLSEKYLKQTGSYPIEFRPHQGIQAKEYGQAVLKIVAQD